jgi:pyruvate,orthophosphate dikinase
MHAAKGILTTRGGMTSHAAVVARGMGTPLRLGRGRAVAASTCTVEDLMRISGRSILLEGATSSPSTARPGRSSWRPQSPPSAPELSGDFGIR